jgi:hypothetical protein
MKLVAPCSGTVVEATGDVANRLIERGYKMLEVQQPKPRRVLRKAKPKDKEQ